MNDASWQFLHRLLFVWALLVGVLAASVPKPLWSQSKPLPSVILISVDTLRADRLSCYGYKKLLTANIDGMVQGGTLFS